MSLRGQIVSLQSNIFVEVFYSQFLKKKTCLLELTWGDITVVTIKLHVHLAYTLIIMHLAIPHVVLFFAYEPMILQNFQIICLDARGAHGEAR